MTLAMMAAPVGSASSRHNESGASTTAMPSVSSATVWTTILRTAPAAELGELRSVLGTQLVAEIEVSLSVCVQQRGMA